MPPKAKDKGGTSATRPSTRRTVNSVLMPEELQDIKDAEGGRKFLEKHSLLCLPGKPVTNTALAICLHQISALSGVPKQTVNMIRATDFLLEQRDGNHLIEVDNLAKWFSNGVNRAEFCAAF